MCRQREAAILYPPEVKSGMLLCPYSDIAQ